MSRIAPSAMMNRLRQLLAGVLAWLLLGAGAQAAIVNYDILLDTDNNPATGCTIATSKGPFAGVEQVLGTQVDTGASGAQVIGVTLQVCSGAALGAPSVVSPGGWAVGLGVGSQGGAVIETFLPLAQLASASTVRAGVMAQTPDGGDALLGAQFTIGSGPQAGAVTPIPTLSPWVLALLAAGVGLTGAWLARRQGAHWVVLGACVLLGAAGVAWAATIAMDGNPGDWAGQSHTLTGAKGDAPPNADLLALWFTHDASNAYFRIDADVVVEPALTLGPLPDRSIPAGQPWSVRIAANASAADAALAYSLPQGPAGAGFAPQPLLKWTPGTGDLGTHPFTVRASDGTREASASFNVTVTAPANRPPVIEPQAPAQIGAGAIFEPTILASDPDGDAFTLQLLGAPAGATLSGNVLRWASGAGDLGEHFFTLQATDSHGASGGARFAVRVVPQAAPVARDDGYIARLGKTLVVSPQQGVLTNDVGPSGGALEAVKQSDPAPDKGVLQAFGVDGSFSYRAPDGLPPPPAFKMKIERSPDKYTPAFNWAVGDLDGDGKPDIIYHWTNIGVGTMRAVKGSDGNQLWEVARLDGPYNDCGNWSFGKNLPVIADVDDDGQAEVVFTVNCKRDQPDRNVGGANYRVVALDGATGQVRWLSEPLLLSASPLPQGELFLHGVVLTVARLTADGPPVVLGAQTEETVNGWCQYMGGTSTDNRCRRVFGLDGRDGSLVRNWYAAAPDQNISPMPNGWTGYDWPESRQATGLNAPPVVADLDGDGQIEVLYQGTLWRENGTREGALLRHLDGTPAVPNSSRFGVGDLDGDGKAEIVIVHKTPGASRAQVRAWRLDGTWLWQAPMDHCGTLACTVSIADTDGDGVPEVLLAGEYRITVLDALGRVRWAKHYPGELGERPIGCDNRPAVYDLDGDGVPEVFLRVTHTLRAWRGDTGAEMDVLPIPGPNYQTVCNSQSPEPRVVDLHGDGSARIVLANSYGGGGEGMFVIKSANDPWMPVRKRHGAWVDLHGVVDDDGHVNAAGSAPGVNGRPNVFGQQVQQATRPDLRTRAQTSFTYVAQSAGLASAPATVRLRLVPANGAPSITSTPPSAWLTIGGVTANFSYPLAAVDPDPGDSLTWSIISYAPTSADARYQPRIDASTGLLTQARASTDQYLYTVRVTDSQGEYAEQAFSVNFTSVATTVPNVSGQSRSAALTTLAGNRLSVGDLAEQFDDAVPAGTVMSHSPASGNSVAQGTAVHLAISKGAAPRPAPNLVGALASAAGGLLPAPFSLGSVGYVYNPSVERGRILSQTPQAGMPVTPGAVNVVVSGGSGLELSLNRTYTNADAPITLTPKALAPDGTPEALPTLDYTVTPLATPYAGSLPTVTGSGATRQIGMGSGTRGAFRVTASGGGRTASADFAVSPPAQAGQPSPMVEYVDLMQTLQGVSDLLEQARGKDPATAKGLVANAVTLWRTLDRDALRLTSPMTVEGGFLPRAAELAAAGVTPGPQDALNKQLLRESIAPLKALTAGLRVRHTPLTELDTLTAAFDAKARLVTGIMPSEYGAVLAAPEYAVIVSHAIPDLMDALMDDLGEGVGLGRESRLFPQLKSTQLIGTKSMLVDTLAALAVDQAIEKVSPIIEAAKKYAKDILGQAAWGAAAVALADHAKEFLAGKDLDAVVSGASMSFRVFESPWAFIEAEGLEWEYTELNTVIMIGPDLMYAAQDVVDKIKEAWKARPSGDNYKSMSDIKKDIKALKAALQAVADSAQVGWDTVERSFQSTDEEPEDCLFSASAQCTQLLFSDGFDSVYHYSGPDGGAGLGGLPVPIVFIVRNNVSGQIFFATPPFLPTPKS